MDTIPLFDLDDTETGSGDDIVHAATSDFLPARALHKPPALPYYLLICTSVVFLIWGELNLRSPSYHDPRNAYANTLTPIRRGNVYMGLASVPRNERTCRKRPFTYPQAYAAVSGDNLLERIAIHGHMDEVVFSFGGEISALLTFYIPDFQLENCTMAFQHILPQRIHPQLRTKGPSHPMLIRPGYFDSTTTIQASANATLDIYSLDQANSLRQRHLIDRLPLTNPNGNGLLVTKPFWCPNSRDMFIQAVCKGDCLIQFGLQAMTAATSIYDLVNKTGFVIKQHEHLSCVKDDMRGWL